VTDATIEWEHFVRIDIRVGRVVQVDDFAQARRPAWRLRIDFGPDIGVKSSSAQITNYGRDELLGRLVLAVVNFPPRQIGPFSSEVLTLGTYRGETVLLANPDPQAQPGDRLG
jgi:tRNA-binding protein